MSEDSAQQKTQQPTPRRLRQAKEKGEIARSRELVTWSVLLSMASSFFLFKSLLLKQITQIAEYNLTFDRQTLMSTDSMFLHLKYSLVHAVIALSPFFVVLTITVLISSCALGGWIFNLNAIHFKWEKLNVLKGLQRLFSKKSLIEMLKSLIKFVLMVAVAICFIYLMFDHFLFIGRSDTVHALIGSNNLILKAFFYLSLSLIAIVAFDVPYQWFSHQQKLKMTLQEVKDEMKEEEGSPELKQKRRSLQEKMAKARMIQDVPRADVIIVNPTHYAVALKYDPDKAPAPYVLAKGREHLAHFIKDLAEQHRVPIVRVPPLARSIYHFTDVSQQIPDGLFEAVAQILAYIHQLRRYRPGKGRRPQCPQNVTIPDELRK